jgi:hypothetical protein
MLKKFVEIIHNSKLVKIARNKVSAWPWYQEGPDGSILYHYFTMKLRVLLSLLSDTLRMNKEVKNRIKNTSKKRNSDLCEVLVIGNGPSANSLTEKQYLRFKKSGGKVLVMNGFVESQLANFVVPDYYCLMDLGYWSPIHESDSERLNKINELLTASSGSIIFMQPANQIKLFQNYENYLFFDGRSVAGLHRIARPDKPWGLPGSVAMMAIASLKFLGHKVIYFTGLDSDASRHYFVNDLNELLWDSRNYYFYNSEEKDVGRQDIVEDGVYKVPTGLINNFVDLLYSDAVFRRDLRWLMAEKCINVGGDRTNDAAPRACLLKD